MRLRIGIASGMAVAGAYGSVGRMKYTTLGTPVNLAARLESYDKEAFVQAKRGHRVLVAEQTVQLLGVDPTLLPLGDALLKGFDATTKIFLAQPIQPTGGAGNESPTISQADPQLLSAS